MKALSTLLRVHRQRLDEQGRVMRDLQALKSQIESEIARLEAELCAEQDVARQSTVASFAFAAYSARNRSASCRIPHGAGPKSRRVEVRFPDPGANPYLGFAALLMAGLDGIKNKIHPGQPMDKDLYDLPPKELKKIPTVCGSLREALQFIKGYLAPDT